MPRWENIYPEICLVFNRTHYVLGGNALKHHRAGDNDDEDGDDDDQWSLAIMMVTMMVIHHCGEAGKKRLTSLSQ